MASSTLLDNDSASQETLARGDLRCLLESAVGVEIGVFGVGECVLPPTCSRSCVAASGGDRLAGACTVVRALAEHEEWLAGAAPLMCDQGHAIAVHSGPVSASLLLAQEADGTERARFEAALSLWERCERLIFENDGLANELLRSFEQLNVMFDVTQQIGRVADAAGVKLVLMRKSAEALTCDWSCCLSPVDGVLWWSRDRQEDQARTVEWIRDQHADALRSVEENRQILVRNAGESVGGPRDASLLFGPFGGEHGATDLVVFGRRRGRPAFVAGDVMMMDAILGHGGHVISNLRLAERIRTMSFEAIRALVSAIDKKDEYTRGHSERVGFLARLIGKQMGLASTALQDLEWAGLLHDIGKIGVLDDVLRKPGKLTVEEFAAIKEHSRMGYDVVAPIQAFAGVREAVLYHHEVPDGSGYPEGLAGDEIPILARIVHVADTFDALTSSRAYREGFVLDKALSIMREEMGTKLDTAVTLAFFEAFDTFRAEQPGRYRQVFGHVKEAAEAEEDDG